ncbi:MAG: 4Fe-4S dicluster domain-containing protein [Dehalococcoidia bacterium]|nr:4Fe-4S dicluster domain-containing protein [Dehalococcoidia bacterium]
MSRFLSREALLAWLDGLREGGTVVVAPTLVEGVSLYRQVPVASEIDLDASVTVVSPKEWLFPASHTIFTVERKDGRVDLRENTFDGRAVLFGLHPCDALGVHLMDVPFLAEPADGSYRERRERTALVGLSCIRCRPECFCTSVDTSPDDPTHLDVMLTLVEGGYVVAAASDKGEALLASAKPEEKALSLPEPPAPEKLPTEDLPRLFRALYDDGYWGRLADRCIHCNICSYVCPTCYCFDMRDYPRGNTAERVQSWESCQAPGFTRLAGGHDTRGSKAAKMRQRFAHKFLYFPETFDSQLSCSGCGRCVRACPVNIDIREIISDLKKIGVSSVGSGEK